MDNTAWHADSTGGLCDSAMDLCPACSLMEVVHHRFATFRNKFGRDPLPDEPLFFDPEADSPVQASPIQVQTQLADACREMGVAMSMLMSFWNLAEDTV
ncbi:MAG TPA: hypothetical protein VMD75_01130 [Candidatus Binataceae bacterium]|jgi:hypothetical protein|nr:hypothetical protein [Candidatus Binataceae bacterium]